MTRPSVALATAAEAEPDEEMRQLMVALAAVGIDAAPAVWDGDVDWRGFDLVVVRSTWDYARRREEFLAWARAVAGATRLLNGPELLAWTTDKVYLRDLADAGVPVVPSVFLEPGHDVEHAYLGAEHVVKPSVSAGSVDTLRIGPDERSRSREHVAAVHSSGRTALVQPYLAEVDSAGETALVYLDGEYSHALRKGALLPPGAGLVSGLFAEEEIAATEPTAAELAVGQACLAALPSSPGSAGPPLYARVDLLPAADGPMVLEVELAEPSLFLHHVPGAADRFAAAIAARL